MKTYLATCFFDADASGRRKNTMARVFVNASSQDEALANLKSHAEKEGYVFRKLETISPLESTEGLGVKEGIQKASEALAFIEPFDRGYVSR